MRLISTLFLPIIFFAALPTDVLAQGVITFGGTVPAVCWITDVTNGSLAGVLGDFNTLTVGKNILKAPTPLAIRLRSNAPYKVMVQVGSLAGITDGTGSPRSTTPQAIKTGDIGFGITAVDVSLSRLVGGGTTPIRADPIAAGYDVRGGWPRVSNGHTPGFAKTLHDIYGADVQLLSGPRISADGDNNSTNNFLTVTVGIVTLPQYLTAGSFSGVVTFTVAPSGA
jgi:type 1 fimbria pilin